MQIAVNEALNTFLDTFIRIKLSRTKIFLMHANAVITFNFIC